jgi:hypothetical protein
MFRRDQARSEVVDAWLRSAGDWMTSGGAVSSVTAHIATTYALGVGGSLDRAQPLLEVVKVGHALRATVGKFGTPPPLPVQGLDVAEVKRLSRLQWSDIGSSSPSDGMIIDQVTAHIQPYAGLVGFWDLLPVDPKVWDKTVLESASRMRRNGYQVSPRAGSGIYRLGYVLRALEEALDLPPGS